jgi:hypothetical protein
VCIFYGGDTGFLVGNWVGFGRVKRVEGRSLEIIFLENDF